MSAARDEGTGQHEPEAVTGEPATEVAGLLAPDVGERDVGAAGVAPGRRPRGLAVAHEVDLTLGFDGHACIVRVGACASLAGTAGTGSKARVRCG